MNIANFIQSKFFKNIILVVLSSVALWLLWRGVKAAIIEPAVDKATAPLKLQLHDSRDSIQLYRQEMLTALVILDSAEADIDSLENHIGELGFFQRQKEAQFQRNIGELVKRGKQKDVLIQGLETGIKNNLVKMVYKNPCLGKERLVDSVFVEGWRYGPLE